MGTKELSSEQKIQEEEYSFPYHYLTTLSPLNDIEYMSYLSIVASYLRNKKANVLDFGCGDGRLEFELRGGGCKIHGIDLSEKAVSFAKAFNLNVKNVSFSVQDILTYRPKKKFGGIVAMEVMEHLPSERCNEIVGAFSRLLTKKGFLIITVPSTNIMLSPKHYRHFDETSLHEMISPYFKIEGIYGQYRMGVRQRIFRGLNVLGRALEVFIGHFQFMKLYEKFLWNYYHKYIEYSPLNKAKRLIVVARKLG